TTGTKPDVLTAAGPGTLYYSANTGLSVPWVCSGEPFPRVCEHTTGLAGSFTYDTAVLTDTKGQPLVGRTVTFSAGGWSQTATTDAQGFAAVSTITEPMLL